MLDKLIESENTDNLYEAWSEYRKALTSDIEDSILHHLTKHKLIVEKKKRLSDEYSIKQAVEDFIAEKGRKPMLAIWGAGGCNDVDISRLSEYFSLVLIDRDIEATERAREKYNVSACACIDIKFFDITYDEYRLVEAMLQDGCTDKQIEEYIMGVVNNMLPPDTKKLPDFDYSVAVGISSQLVARLNALFCAYNAGDRFEKLLKKLSDKAVEKMFNIIDATTDSLIIYGYELCSYDESVDQNTIKIISEALSEEFMVEKIDEWIKIEGDKIRFPDRMGLRSDVVGNQRLIDRIMEKNVLQGKYTLIDRKTEVWPFTFYRKYLMHIMALERL